MQEYVEDFGQILITDQHLFLRLQFFISKKIFWRLEELP